MSPDSFGMCFYLNRTTYSTREGESETFTACYSECIQCYRGLIEACSYVAAFFWFFRVVLGMSTLTHAI